MTFMTKTAFACSLVSGGEELLIAESVSILRTYQTFVLSAFAATVLITILRKGKGWWIVVAQAIPVALSPGWFPKANAGYDNGCEPSGDLEMKLILATQIIGLMIQAAFLFSYQLRWFSTKKIP